MSAQVVTVGASLSPSGRFAPQGRQAYQGLRLWAEEANRQGGLLIHPGEPRRRIVLAVANDASLRAEAAEQTRRLIVDERIDVLVGPYSSVLALVAAEVAAEHDRTLWNHGGSTDVLDGQTGERRWPHVVNLLSPASQYFVPLLDLTVQAVAPPVRRVALIQGARGTFPAAVINGARAHARRVGMEIVHESVHVADDGSADGDVYTVVRRRTAPELILSAGLMETEIQFARAWGRAEADPVRRSHHGRKPRLVGLVAAGVQAFADALGPDADGFLGPSQWEPTLRDRPALGPTSAEFAWAFREHYGMEPDYPAAQAYAAGLLAAHCIERAGTLDDQAVRAVAARLDTTTFYGRFRLDAATGQQVGHQIVVVQWQAGQKVIVWPKEVANGSLVLP